MKVKLDENLPRSLVSSLTLLGHDVDTAPDEHLYGKDDSIVWQAAQVAGRFLITQDLDFSDIRKFAPGTHHGLLLIRLHAPGRISLSNRVEEVFRTENVSTWRRCFVVVTDRKVRVRRP